MKVFLCFQKNLVVLSEIVNEVWLAIERKKFKRSILEEENKKFRRSLYFVKKLKKGL